MTNGYLHVKTLDKNKSGKLFAHDYRDNQFGELRVITGNQDFFYLFQKYLKLS